MSPLLIAGIALCFAAAWFLAEKLSSTIQRPSIVPIEEALERDRKLMSATEEVRLGEQDGQMKC